MFALNTSVADVISYGLNKYHIDDCWQKCWPYLRRFFPSVCLKDLADVSYDVASMPPLCFAGEDGSGRQLLHHLFAVRFARRIFSMRFARKIYLHQRLGVIFCRWYILVAALASFCSMICTENMLAPTTWCNIFRIQELWKAKKEQ